MKGRNLLFSGLIIALVGLLLIIFRTSLADGGVVKVAGIIFIAAGVLNVTVFLGSRDKNGNARTGTFGTIFGWVASAAAVLMGLSMLLFSKAFVAIIGFMFAVLLLFAAVFQLFVLIFGTRPVKLSGWFYLVPLILVGFAIFVFLRKPDTAGETTDLVLTGIGFIIFGLGGIVEGAVIGDLNRRALKSAKAAKKAVLQGKETVTVEKPKEVEEAPKADAEEAPKAEAEEAPEVKADDKPAE